MPRSSSGEPRHRRCQSNGGAGDRNRPKCALSGEARTGHASSGLKHPLDSWAYITNEPIPERASLLGNASALDLSPSGCPLRSARERCPRRSSPGARVRESARWSPHSSSEDGRGSPLAHASPQGRPSFALADCLVLRTRPRSGRLQGCSRDQAIRASGLPGLAHAAAKRTPSGVFARPGDSR
jgi:hypothetical protein